MVALMRFTRDICRLFGIGGGPAEQHNELMDCEDGAVPEQSPKDAATSQDGLAGEESLTEEERARRRTERRRAKRMRRRERKKSGKQMGKNETTQQDDEGEENGAQSESEGSGSEKEDEAEVCADRPARPLAASKNKGDRQAPLSSCEEDPGWDVSSAFVANAASHIRPKGRTCRAQGSRENKENEARTKEEAAPDPVTRRSTLLAQKGIKLWEQEQYSQAVSMFTEAIHCNPKDHRFFGNRSCCYACLGEYSSALLDAEKAIELAPQWPMGFYRKGRALMGMKRYSEAERAMEQVLKLDPSCDDADYDLVNCRILQLMELGFEESQSRQLLEKYTSVQDAQNSPEAARMLDLESLQNLSEMPCPSLWVGNITMDVTEKHLRDLFKTCGEIESIRVLHERFCAFVNFKNTNMATHAMEKLQGVKIENTKLVIRYPDRRAQRSTGSPQKATSSGAQLVTQQAASSGSRRKGPINGDECYFWRTTGCHFGDKCRYKHIPAQQGKDKKPWQPQ
ncbi:hsp70-Hsp90 organizing protein 3 [Scleropages formosus]|uniref:Zgc:123010 n=1 Tax=Scleropages formosus TaxID=113540 RepID=A0A8C9TJV3_SCLFO|nr:hsp70-Hsp90 organizing protein 3-like [Scleropages formosus]